MKKGLIKYRAWDNDMKEMVMVSGIQFDAYSPLEKPCIIVKCGYGVGEVIFQAGCFMVQWIDDKEAYLEFVFSRKGMYARKNDEQFEIIGNIYEKIK